MNHIDLYRLLGEAERPPAPAKNLLQNSSFEETDPQGGEQGWYMFGNPLIDRSGSRAHSGKVAILASTQGGFAQKVPVKPDELYRLSHWTRSDQPGQTERLQINWQDSNGKQIGFTIEFVTTTSQWQWHEMFVSAPKDAAYGQVYASVQGDSQVWFDDMDLINGDR